jgi:hypothetical protein
LKYQLTEKTLEWLLEGEPWVVYRTLTHILGKGEKNREVLRVKESISNHPLIKNIFNRLNKAGYWGTPKDIHTWWPRKDTTFWLLPVLADFGFTRDDKKIAKVCEYVFSTQLPSGGFGWDPPNKPGDCHSAIIIESLTKMGFLRDRRLQKSYDWLIQRQRLDGGFWCKDSGQVGRIREKEPSCALATMFVLGALAQNPEYKNSPKVKSGIDFLLNCWKNQGKIKYAGHDSQIGTDWAKLKYPFTDYKILKYLDVISQFEYGQKKLHKSKMVDLLLSKQDDQGRFTPESINQVWSNLDFGQKENPSRWITFLALHILKKVSWEFCKIGIFNIRTNQLS